MSRLESLTISYKDSLDKAIDEGSHESIKDLLETCRNLPMTYDLLKSTLIGQTVHNARKKYPNTEIAILAKEIINLWKSSCQKPSIDQESSSNDNQIKPKKDLKPSNDSTFDYEKLTKNLNEGRIKIIDLLASHLKHDCDEGAAKFISFCIEDAVNSKYHHENDKKDYKEKLKSLSFNLKQNKNLREQLINGLVQPSELVSMSANDLATEETRLARDKIAEDSFNERRSDMYELKRGEIQAANGIDPNKGGEFTCKKCKSVKTTNYQMQTRSADEPMTVFIRCLTCGNRWRM